MNALEELLADESRKSAARFFLRIGQAGKAAKAYDEHTLPLFPLVLILEAEGLLTSAARHLVSHEANYLRRCEAVIKHAARELETA